MCFEERLLMRLSNVRASHVLIVIGAFLMASWTAFFAVDVLNIAGLRDRLAASSLGRPMLWAHIFREGGPAEWLQWICLGGAALLMGAAAGRDIRVRPPIALFWLILGLGMMLMLIEDAGNPRHMIRRAAFTATGSDLLAKSAEFAVFSLLAAVPLYALLRFGPQIWPYRRARTFVLLGFVIYGLVGMSNATRHWGEWHAVVGEWLYAVFQLELTVVTGHRPDLPPGFWLMDKLIEESVELLGAACFLSAIVAYYGDRHPPATPATNPTLPDNHESRALPERVPT